MAPIAVGIGIAIGCRKKKSIPIPIAIPTPIHLDYVRRILLPRYVLPFGDRMYSRVYTLFSLAQECRLRKMSESKACEVRGMRRTDGMSQ